ncbi:MAG TPA: c-type cytochrome [Candidatus Limnocylindria bacterium]|jgi:putative heme-binding domain-containing protein|nr:c-type cytochrome [Candidatus Limnocylindria bacterium]
MLLNLLRFLPILLAGVWTATAQTPEWIWGDQSANGETRYFRKQFSVPAGTLRGVVTVAADNGAEVKINGQTVARNSNWQQATSAVWDHPTAGSAILEIKAQNEDGAAGLLVRVELVAADRSKTLVVSDSSWETSTDGKAGWKGAKSLGKNGIDPWGDVLKSREATTAESLELLPQFKAELLRSATPSEGSWVSMTVDPKGRLIVSPQGSEPMLRITLTPEGQIANLEPISVPVSGAMGLLYAFDSLYANAQGPDGYHLYRIRDTNGDDKYDKVELVRRWKNSGEDGGPGEHGAHGILAGPDGRLYVVCGNFVDVPADISTKSPVRNYGDDLALPRMEDGNGFGSNRKPPGGFVLRCDPDGKNPELFAAGQRNTYDIAFNASGELFGFDSDMEWDWGTPWYRPTRVYHIVSGADQGFREGSGKYPEYYQDSLPSVVQIGIGSPTGVHFGGGLKYPAKYQQAFYIMDWSYGRILAVHLAPSGATYSAQYESFVRGKPLNVTDMVPGPDGALYFTTGGRGTQSGLYRVAYTGNESTSPASSPAPATEEASLRHELEKFHGATPAPSQDLVWKGLQNSDRHVRYAARLVLENLPVATWKERALTEKDVHAGLTALLALARTGEKSDAIPLLKALGKWPLPSLDEENQLLKLRVIEVAFSRFGIPEEIRAMAIERLDRIYPANSWALNRELSQLLVALDAPDAVTKTLALRDASTIQEEQVHYQAVLRAAKAGWSTEDRKRYYAWFYLKPGQETGGFLPAAVNHPPAFVQWFHDVGLEAGNGASYPNFLKGIRQKASAGLADNEKGELATWITGTAFQTSIATKATPVVQHKFVKNWKMADLAPALPQAAKGRDFARGKALFTEAQCIACHRFNGEGGAIGPDLTGLSSRFTRPDILTSILDPSAVISEQYQALSFTLKNDDDVTGRVVEETSDKFVVVTDSLRGTKTEVNKSEVKSRNASKISPMPEGLVDILTRDEILDLIAYLESNGQSGAPAFKK